MSGRLLKKVLKEQEQLLPRQHESEDEEKLSPVASNRPQINPFDLLNAAESDPDEENDNGIGESVLEEEDYKNEETKVVFVAESNKKSKKKKKKKGKSGQSLGGNKVGKPIDEELEVLSLDNKSLWNESRSAESVVENLKDRKQGSVLQVDLKCLNPENELRRIFGSKVVKSFERSSNQASGSRIVRGGRRGGFHTRKTILVSPSEHWPRWDGSLSMEFLETKDGYNQFRYVHSISYGQAQRAFEAAKAIHDLNGIASILLHHPYHLDSLITMADYFKFVGEHQMAADAIAKSLYALECAWDTMFTPLQGNCQLKITHEANKAIFTTLFTHMRNMDRRGCHRSALEVCKLLLSLDVDDPMGAIFCIDYFALRAEEYEWLERFSEEYKSDNSLWLFPNFSYSLAICRFYLEQEEASKNNTELSTKSASKELMKQALMLHPSAVKKLVAKVPLKDQAWTKILQHAFFRSEKAGSPTLDHLINIYVERSYIIWRLPDLQKLLRDSALQVIENLEHNSIEAKDWACVSREAFSSDNNEYSHLMVSDFSDVVPTLPPENLQNFMADPRMRVGEVNGAEIANELGDIPAPRDVANRNALAVLLESVLPWVHYGNREDGGANEDEHADGQRQNDD